MECARLCVVTALPRIQILYFVDLSVVFKTTTAMDLSGLIKAVARRLSSLEEQIILRAPGRMNLENCPI